MLGYVELGAAISQTTRLRMSRGDGTTTVDYVWDVAGGLPMLLQDGTHTYVYGLGLIAIYDGSEMTYRLVDGLGSTVNLCDEDGDLIGEYSYDAYGNVRSQDGAETEFSFVGEQSDPNGLDFLRARYYDPEIGRFLGRDPAGQGRNGYAYTLNNPVNLVDPSGLWTICRGWATSDASTGESYCAIPQEVTTVYSSQVVMDEKGNWVLPTQVDDWKDGDWYCSGAQQLCISQVDVQPTLKDDLAAVGRGSRAYNWNVASGAGWPVAVPLAVLYQCDEAAFANDGTFTVSGCEGELDTGIIGDLVEGCSDGAVGIISVGQVLWELGNLPYGNFDLKDVRRISLKNGLQGCAQGAVQKAVGLELPGPF